MSSDTWGQSSKATDSAQERWGRQRSIRGDLWQKDSGESEDEGLQDGNEICYGEWFGDGGAELESQRFQMQRICLGVQLNNRLFLIQDVQD